MTTSNKIKIVLTKDDWSNFSNHLLIKRKANSKKLIIFQLFSWGVVALTFAIFFINIDLIQWSSFFIGGMSILSIILYVILQSYIPNSLLTLQSNSLFLQSYEYMFNKNGIKCSSDESESKFSWSRVIKIEKTRDYIMIFLDETVAILLPKSQLSDFEELYADLKNLYDAYPKNNFIGINKDSHR